MEVRLVLCLTDYCSNWNLEILVFEERSEYPEKNLLAQRRKPSTNSAHLWCRRRDLNPGHIERRRVPLLLRQDHTCSRNTMRQRCYHDMTPRQPKGTALCSDILHLRITGYLTSAVVNPPGVAFPVISLIFTLRFSRRT